MLKEKTLFENIDKVKIAIERLKAFEPKEGYYLAFSGGKDSIVIKKLAQMAGVKFDAHYSATTIDPPDLIYFIREHHAEVVWDRPEIPFLKKLETKGFPLRQARWCCALYKENGGSGRRVITGIRWAESFNRSKRKMTEQCLKGNGKSFMNVIIDWTDEDVWDFIYKYKIPYCKLYDEGWKRIGCLMCPMATNKHKQVERARYPAFTAAYIKSFERLYAMRKAKGSESIKKWNNGREMFEWWINEQKSENKDQMMMFD